MRLFAFLGVLTLSAVAQDRGLTGDWLVTFNLYGSPEYARWNFENKDGHYTVRFFGMQLDAAVDGNRIQFSCTEKHEDNIKDCGKLTGIRAGDEIRGSGALNDMEQVSFTARRVSMPAATARIHDFTPAQFFRQFNGNTEPALHLNPGDTVRTKSVDAGGKDEHDKTRSLGGNPLTGPFFIESAWPGDTLVVHLNRVRLNRDSAGIYNNSVVAGVLDPYYSRDLKPPKNFESTWKLDRDRGTASLTKPTGPLKDFVVEMHPMLGCIGVAPPGRQAFQSGNLGRYGGNMDYNQVREGVTVYLPVFQPGALLFLGDGHAAQGDGELTGNALETSMDVEFTVDLIHGKSLGQPRFENTDFMMVSGIAGSLDDALRMATTGLSRWLEQEYKLNAGEIAMVLGSSMRYDIAEVVDPQVHVVAKLRKAALSKIAKP
jgi:acetamidase/formamidase